MTRPSGCGKSGRGLTSKTFAARSWPSSIRRTTRSRPPGPGRALPGSLGDTGVAPGAGVEEGDYAARLVAPLAGERVVDLWTGPGCTGDSLTGVFSSTKGAAHLVVALHVQGGVLDLDQRVAHYWPEFGAAGKGGIPTGAAGTAPASSARTTGSPPTSSRTIRSSPGGSPRTGTAGGERDRAEQRRWAASRRRSAALRHSCLRRPGRSPPRFSRSVTTSPPATTTFSAAASRSSRATIRRWARAPSAAAARPGPRRSPQRSRVGLTPPSARLTARP